MIIGTLCLSHSPLKDRNRAGADVEARFDAAVTRAADLVAREKPDLTVILYPDHVNGFFYNLLPPFCVGLEGQSIGDYGTAAGRLDIPTERASDLAAAILRSGVDVAISHDMQVDHGAMQPIEWLSESYPLSRIIPIFVNCAAPPLPPLHRARALGAAVGEWARQAPERILIVGSGGLSHDPPVPALATASAVVRARLVAGGQLDHAQRFARQSRAHREGGAMVAGHSTLLRADAAWDRAFLDALLAGDLASLDALSDGEISATGGRGGHEARTWIAALAALGEGYVATEFFYDTIHEWITGMGILHAEPARS